MCCSVLLLPDWGLELQFPLPIVEHGDRERGQGHPEILQNIFFFPFFLGMLILAGLKLSFLLFFYKIFGHTPWHVGP